ncbi:MAG: glycosyltransferase family 4 protein [Armatimonadota bacterium]
MKSFSGPVKRVLMLSWEFPPRVIGGIARHVDELSRALASAGVEVDVLTAHHPGAPSEETLQPGLRVLRAGPPPVQPVDFICDIHQLDFGLLQRFLTAGRIRPRDYDLIHAHEWLVAFAARSLRFGLDLPLVATIHATEWGRNGGIRTPMQQYIHSVEWMLAYDAWRVICCSHAMEGELQTALQVPTDKVRVIPNGVEPRRLQSSGAPKKLAAFRRRWARDDERIVLFVGRLVREKGVEVLIDSMPEVLSAHPDARLVVAGGGPRDHLVGRAARHGLSHKVTFAGYVSDELADLYAVADVAVFPSLYEPFGIVALEAMAAGVPVITSDIGGFREVVRHGATGLHTWANNPRSLAWGITQVLGDPFLATRLGRRARREVLSRFNWQGIAEQTLGVYQEVLDLAAERATPAVFSRAAAPEAIGPGLRARYLGVPQGELAGVSARS